MPDLSLEPRFAGAHWRIEHEACTTGISQILTAICLPDFLSQLRNQGRLAGTSLYDDTTLQPDFAGRRSERVRKEVAEMMERAYLRRVPEMTSLLINLGLIRHCSIFEAKLIESIGIVLQYNHTLIPDFSRSLSAEISRTRNGGRASGSDPVRLVLAALSSIRGMKTRLNKIEKSLGICFDDVLADRDIYQSLNPTFGRAYLLSLFQKRADFVHKLEPQLTDESDLRNVSECFEQFASSIYRGIARSAGIDAFR